MTGITPKIIEFQTISLCNAKCTICPYPDLKTLGKPKTMSDKIWEILKINLLDIKPSRVIPYLNNEPLLDLTIENKIRQLKNLLSPVTIELSTNGLLLNEKRVLELFSVGLDELLISIFGFDSDSHKVIMNLDYEKVINNVKKALELKIKTNSQTLIKIIQVDIPNINKEELRLRRQEWRDMGADVEVYGYLDRAGNITDKTLSSTQRNHFQLPNGCELKRHEERIYLLTDGTILFCCHDWRHKYPMGNILNESIRNIWNSENYNNLRQQVNGKINSDLDFLCRHCKLCLT